MSSVPTLPIDRLRESLAQSYTAKRAQALRRRVGRSRQNMERLARFLRQPASAKRKVLLVGFANPAPRSPHRPLSLSQDRVDYVSSELLALNVKVVSVR